MKQNNNERALTTIETSHGTIELSSGVIKRLFAPMATEEEAYMFLRVCQAQGLNPFLGEAYLIKYDSHKPANIVTGKDTFTQRAERHPQYAGMEYGVIVERDKMVIDLVGSFTLAKDTLLGGWSKVHRKDRERPVEKRVSLKEYSTGQSTWSRMPGTMMEKVAIVQGLREAFPSEFVGLYDSAEIGVDITNLPALPEAAAVVEAEEPAPAPKAPETGAQAQETAKPATTMPSQGVKLGRVGLKALGERRGLTLATMASMAGLDSPARITDRNAESIWKQVVALSTDQGVDEEFEAANADQEDFSRI